MQIRRLNTLRGIAALVVLVGHYSNRAQLWDAVLGTRAPQLGVMLFFLLSAFLMTVLYLDRPPTAPALRGYASARPGSCRCSWRSCCCRGWPSNPAGPR